MPLMRHFADITAWRFSLHDRAPQTYARITPLFTTTPLAVIFAEPPRLMPPADAARLAAHATAWLSGWRRH